MMYSYSLPGAAVTMHAASRAARTIEQECILMALVWKLVVELGI